MKHLYLCRILVTILSEYTDNRHAQSVQYWPNLCNPMACTLSGSSVRGILQARILEWVAIPFFRGPSQPRTEHTCLVSLALAAGSIPLVPPYSEIKFFFIKFSKYTLYVSFCTSLPQPDRTSFLNLNKTLLGLVILLAFPEYQF